MNGAAAPPPHPWGWVPTLYAMQALPYALVMTLSVVLYKRMGVSNAELALLTSWFYLPWVIKPLWAPWLDTRVPLRATVVRLQWAMAGAAIALALALQSPAFLMATLILFGVMALLSATHDAAADGLYIAGLPAAEQSRFVGVRTASWRGALIVGQGGVIAGAGWLETTPLGVQNAWTASFLLFALVFAALALLHGGTLPRPAQALQREGGDSGGSAWVESLGSFLRRPDLLPMLAFLLLYRFGEAQMLKLVIPFLLDARADGGLGLSTQQVGVIYGGVGVGCTLAGGLLGGVLIARRGLAAMLWPMVVLMHAPNLLFVALAVLQPASPWVIGAAVAAEQLGYGFGFTAYTVYMLKVAAGSDGRSPWATSHYALCTGLMALGMMLPGLWSGALQEALGYSHFFVWVCLASLLSMGVVWWCRQQQPLLSKETLNAI